MVGLSNCIITVIIGIVLSVLGTGGIVKFSNVKHKKFGFTIGGISLGLGAFVIVIGIVGIMSGYCQ